MKDIQLDMFDGSVSEDMFHSIKILEIEQTQDRLRKGIFMRYQDHNDRIEALERMLQELAGMVKVSEQRELDWA